MIASLTPWVDAGSAGTVALARLERHLGARDLGSLATPGAYFDFTRYRPQAYFAEGQRRTTVPNTNVRYGLGQKGFDFILVHMLEPHSQAEEYIDSIVELLKHFQVRRYCRIGAMYDIVPHTRPLPVTGSLNGEPLAGVEGVAPSRGTPYQGPTSIMYMVGEKIRGLTIEELTLMARLPQYVKLEEDYSGAARLLNVLCALYGFPSELGLSRRGVRQYQQVSEEVERNPELKALVERLEADYDAAAESLSRETPQPPAGTTSSLPPSVEEFLEELDNQDDTS